MQTNLEIQFYFNLLKNSLFNSRTNSKQKNKKINLHIKKILIDKRDFNFQNFS